LILRAENGASDESAFSFAPRPLKSLMSVFTRQTRALLIILGIGLAARIIVLGLPGTSDMAVNQTWGTVALEHGVTRIYIFNDAYYLDKLAFAFKGIPFRAKFAFPTPTGILDYVPNYPPLSLYYFAAATWICSILQGGHLHAGKLLNACFNFPSVVASFATALVALRFVQKELPGREVLVTAAFWLSPVMFYFSPVLGYVDSVFALFGLLCLVFLYRRRYTASLFFLAISIFLKPQGVLILPVVAAVIVYEVCWRTRVALAARFILFCLLPYAPFIPTARALAAMNGTFSVIHVWMLSWQKTNFWWLIGWIAPFLRTGQWRLLTRSVEMTPAMDFKFAAHVDPRPIALALTAAFLIILLRFLIRQLRAGNRLAIFWAAALCVFGYTMLTLYPHENHLYPFFVYALPLLALSEKEFLKVYAWLSLIFALNLYLFDGFGRGTEAWANSLRNGLRFDLSVALALANLLVFGLILVSSEWKFPFTRTALVPAPASPGGQGSQQRVIP
jgi:hypothetical protein